MQTNPPTTPLPAEHEPEHEPRWRREMAIKEQFRPATEAIGALEFSFPEGSETRQRLYALRCELGRIEYVERNSLTD